MTEEEIPEQYKQFADVFSEEKAKRFPPQREEDHEINFTPEAPKAFKPSIYHMDREKTVFMRKWINEELKKGFI